MELIKILLLICILLVYPLFPGSFVRRVFKKKNSEYGLGTIYVAGVLSCGVFFGVLAFFGVRFGMSLDVFSKAVLLTAVLLPLLRRLQALKPVQAALRRGIPIL